MDAFTEGTRAVVCFRSSFVEIADTTVTLQDVCEAFGVPYESGVFVRDRRSERPVATLPFEPVYVAVAREKANEDAGASGFNPRNVLEDGDGDEGGVVLLDFISPQTRGDGILAAAPSSSPCGAPDKDALAVAVDAAGGDTNAGAAAVTAVPSISGDDAVNNAVMSELVRLGAVELLSQESAARLANATAYDPRAAPGLLLRAVYPSSCYSPYRTQRDPLLGTSTSDTGAGADRNLAGTLQKDGALYTSSLEVYGVDLVAEDDLLAYAGGECEEDRAERVAAALLRLRPDLAPLTDDEVARFFA